MKLSKAVIDGQDHANVLHSQNARPRVVQILAPHMSHTLCHVIMKSLLPRASPPIAIPEAAYPGCALVPGSWNWRGGVRIREP